MSTSNIFNMSTHDRSLLWSYEPPSGTIEIVESIELDLTGYKLLEVVCQQASGDGPKKSTIIINDPSIAAKQMLTEGYGSDCPAYQLVTVTSSGIDLGDIYTLGSAYIGILASTMLPIRIYGIR